MTIATYDSGCKQSEGLVTLPVSKRLLSASAIGGPVAVLWMLRSIFTFYLLFKHLMAPLWLGTLLFGSWKNAGLRRAFGGIAQRVLSGWERGLVLADWFTTVSWGSGRPTKN